MTMIEAFAAATAEEKAERRAAKRTASEAYRRTLREYALASVQPGVESAAETRRREWREADEAFRRAVSARVR